PNPRPNPQSFLYGPLLQAEYFAPEIYTFNTFNLNYSFVDSSQSYFVTNSLMPHWSLLVSNRLQVVMLESNRTDHSFHVIDYVQLIGPEKAVDLTGAITNLYDTEINPGYDDMWDTTLINGTPLGMLNQIAVSAQEYPIIQSPYWSQQNGQDVTNQIAGFRAFLGYGAFGAAGAAGEMELAMQAPYTPTATVASLTLWEVNDPLVHYLASDLAGSSQYTQPVKTIIP